LTIFLLSFAALLGMSFGMGVSERWLIYPTFLQEEISENYPNGVYTIDKSRLKEEPIGVVLFVKVLVALWTILALAHIYFALQSTTDLGFWWLTAAIFSLLEQIFTVVLIFPIVVRLQKAYYAESEEQHLIIKRWLFLFTVKNILKFVAFITILNALTYL
jgi:hypothetical protein